MRKFGLIGYPLSHSFSPGYFNEKFEKLGITDAMYDLFPLQNLDDFSELLPLMDGINVTIPYKEKVIPYLDKLSESAKTIGAVNCIKIEDGISVGYNTDYYGFQTSILQFLNDAKDIKALVLGQGGAALAIKAALDSLSIPYLPISRNKPYLTYEELDESHIKEHRLIINTTPLGMYPNVKECPKIPYKSITNQHFLFDVVYNPEKTLFLALGEKNGAKIMNGHQMLILQAEKSWEIWNNQ